MIVLTLQIRHRYGDPSKGNPPESPKPNCRKTCLNIFPRKILGFILKLTFEFQFGVYIF
jgi:hypothetical protein